MKKFKTIVLLTTALLLSTISFLVYPLNRPSIYLVKTNFNYLTRWKADKQYQALLAFDKSCDEIRYRNPNAIFSRFREGGTVRQWQIICQAAQQLGKTSNNKARQFFEFWFTPYAIKTTQYHYGLFTGYYLPILRGSLHKTNRYAIPVYGLPTDLVEIGVSASDRNIAIRKVIRQVKNNKLYPYPDRAAIENGAIKEHAPIILWVNSKIDLFFAQIQGSAGVMLTNGQKLLLNYAGHNGKPYLSIGKILVDKKILSKNSVSMQTIRVFLTKHPQQIDNLLNCDPSYVFFKISKKGPFGTEHIPLTPQRSLAIDINYLPLGVPLWLNTIIPNDIATQSYKHYRHLFIAQDTGGAIKGGIRGDIYWGSTRQANFFAGNMKSPGEYWILLPKHLLFSND